MTKCYIHGCEAPNQGICPRCRSCSHKSFWMNAVDFKESRFRCSNCYQVFSKVLDNSEIMVLWQGKWVDYYALKEKNPAEEVVEIVVPTLHKCVECGEQFEASRSDAKFCGTVCKLKSNRKKIKFK